MANTINSSLLKRVLLTTALSLALTLMGASVAPADTVFVSGAAGADGDGGSGLPGGLRIGDRRNVGSLEHGGRHRRSRRSRRQQLYRLFRRRRRVGDRQGDDNSA